MMIAFFTLGCEIKGVIRVKTTWKELTWVLPFLWVVMKSLEINYHAITSPNPILAYLKIPVCANFSIEPS